MVNDATNGHEWLQWEKHSSKKETNSITSGIMKYCPTE
jgi:hypothetical protein